MRNFSDLLKRFTDSLNKDEVARQRVVEAALSVARIRIDPKDVSLKEGVLTLSLGASAKNEFFLKEEKMKEALKNLYGMNVRRVIYK